jgi:hypothetical protein
MDRGSWQGRGNFLFAISSRPEAQLASNPLCTWSKADRSVEFTTHLHLVPRLGMRGSVPPIHHPSSWRGAKLYFTFYHLFSRCGVMPISVVFLNNLTLQNLASYVSSMSLCGLPGSTDSGSFVGRLN